MADEQKEKAGKKENEVKKKKWEKKERERARKKKEKMAEDDKPTYIKCKERPLREKSFDRNNEI